MGRTEACAAAIHGASAPVPTSVRRRLSARERYLEARADAAAVRSRVTIVPSMQRERYAFGSRRRR